MEKLQEIWPEWNIEEEIGSGAYGSVYKVSKDLMGKKIYAAIKIVRIPQNKTEIKEWRSQGMDDGSIRSHYKERLDCLNLEILILEELKTANNIVTIEEYKLVENKDGIGGTLYIRMELLQSVETYLQNNQKFSVGEVVQLGIDMCSALMACERHQIIHRDIKPSNILINEYGEYKLGDFGISKQLEDVTSAKSKTGTEMYMAPEIYKAKSYNKTVDIYSLGITLYKLLNDNRFPYTPPYPQIIRPVDLEEAMASRMEGKPMENPSNADGELSYIIKRACECDARKRYQSAEQMKKDLIQWQVNNLSDAMEKSIVHSDLHVSMIESELKQTQGGRMAEKSSSDLSNVVKETTFNSLKDTEKTVSAFEETISAFGKTDEPNVHKQRILDHNKQERKSHINFVMRGRDINDTLWISEELIGTTVIYKGNNQEIEVLIPLNTIDGEILHVPGKGEAMQGGINGDLYLQVKLVNTQQTKKTSTAKNTTGTKVKEKIEESPKSCGWYIFWWVMSCFGMLGFHCVYLGDWGEFWIGRLCWGVIIALCPLTEGISLLIGVSVASLLLVGCYDLYKKGELKDGKERVILPKK